MTRLTRYARPLGLLLGLLLLAGTAAAQGRGRMMNQPGAEFQRFSLSLLGGYGFQEHGRGLADFKAELQYGFSRSLRLALSAGYLTRVGHDGGMGRNGMGRNGRGRMGGGMMDRLPMGNRMFPQPEPALGHDLRAVPIGLNLIYALPLGRRWSSYLSGGGTFAFGSFGAARGSVHKNAFGGQAGLGFEYALTAKVRLAAEAGYRFLTFTGVRPPQPEPSPMLRLIDNPLLRRIAGRVLTPRVRPVDIGLSGFSLRAGLKFGL